MWTHLVPDSDPIRTGSTRSRVNTRLIRTNFVPVPNGSGPCKRCLKQLPIDLALEIGLDIFGKLLHVVTQVIIF